jgi:transcriptional regulator of heat shock response
MKPGSITTGKTLLALLVIAATAFALISWGHRQQPAQIKKEQYYQDTVPPKKDKKIRDLDEVIAELDNIDLKLQMEKALKEVAEAMKHMDAEKMRLDIEKSMKEVDFEKIKMEVDKAMKDVDLARIEKEVKESLAKIDWDKMKAELDEVKKIDLKEVDQELAKAKKELENIRPRIEKEMQKAKLEIEKAKIEMKEYKSFVDGLANDGLIDKKEGYSIKNKGGRLIINDKEASDKTYDKYKSFLEKHPKFNIEKNKDDFNINMD